MNDVGALSKAAQSNSRAAERMRRHRERRREGLRCVRVEIRESEIRSLVRRGLLKEECRHDPDAIVSAVYAFLDQKLGDGYA